MRRRIAVILAAIAAAAGLSVATPQAANALPPGWVRSTVQLNCNQWDDAGTGYLSAFVDRYTDTSVNPDKERPLKFQLANHYNHTISIDQVTHSYVTANGNPPIMNWWTNTPFTLSWNGTPASQSATEQVGYFPYDPNFTINPPPNTIGGSTYNTWVRAGTSIGVTSYSPELNPWWAQKLNDGPYFTIEATLQGKSHICEVWY